ncbi:MAG: carbohydrate-binding domain-containing protein [Solobacterium sp.]|nr:carbohydrate-binding domain-containing protein [Solobacterium sp.]
MSTHKRFDLICVAVMICAILLTVLFMNGEQLGIKVMTDYDTDRNEGQEYFTENDLNGDWNTETAAVITLNNDSASVSGSGAYAYNGSVFITQSGKYVISGTLDDGSIVVDAEDNSKIWILLDGVSITNDDGACIDIEQADKVFLTLAEGSKNMMVSGSAYSSDNTENGIHGTVFSRDDLTINGSGSLTVEGAYKHGIEVNDDMVITGGTITVTGASDALHVNDSLRICNASVTLSGGDEGIDLDKEEGWFYLSSGTLNITSTDDGIHTEGDVIIDGGTLRISAGDDGIHSGTSVEVNGGEILISECYEGIEAPQITMNGGDVTVYSSDDGLNANGGLSTGFGGFGGWGQTQNTESSETAEDEELSCVTINGGSLTIINASGIDADGIDSNGNIFITGGDIRVSLTGSGTNNAFDYGSESGGVCEISGGTVIAAGSYSMAEAFDATSEQCSVLYTYSSGTQADTEVSVQDSEGNVLLSWTVPNSFTSLNLSCPEMKTGETYRIQIGENTEEITLEEVSASYGDAQSSGFGGMHFGGGMRPGDSFGQEGNSEFQPSESFDPSMMKPGDMPEGSENGTMPSADPSQGMMGQRPQGGHGNHSGFRPGQNYEASGNGEQMMPSESADAAMEMPGMNGEEGSMPSFDPSGMMPGGQGMEPPGNTGGSETENLMPSESSDPSAMTPPEMPEGTDGQMTPSSGDPRQGMPGSMNQEVQEEEITEETAETAEEITAETLMLDFGAVILLAAALIFVKLYRKPLH